MPLEDVPFSGYNSMQQQAGLLPAQIAVPPPIIFPGQVTAAIATGGVGAAMNFVQALPPPQVQGFGGMGGYPGPSAIPNAGYGAPSVYAAQQAPPPYYAGPQMQPGMFGAGPAPGLFDTPYGTSVGQSVAAANQQFANYSSYAGIGARVGAGALAGFAGAAIGGRLGGVAGAALGGLGAMYGAERFGVGRYAQGAFMEQFVSPALQQRGFAAGLEHLSQGFVPFGGGPMGSGFTAHEAERAAEQITGMANSASFRRSTFDKFNAADLGSITQGASRAGLLGGSRDVEGMTQRVREVAKSLSAFMELAQEPDVQRALQAMGNLRSSGLNLSETLGAVQSGRAFARLAGTSFQDMLEVGGGGGGAMFQSMGLGAGLGTRAGMANYGMAMSAQNGGILDPALMSLVRGPQGLAAMRNQFSANMLNMPMLAPAMMTTAGGLNPDALRGLANGSGNLFDMTSRGANNLIGMTGRLGVEGLGMAVGMQPLLRDAVGRMLQAQGPYAQRNMEDSQIVALSRQMGMRGAGGFITAAMAMGSTESDAIARAQEVSSPSFYRGQRNTARLRQREARAQADRIREDRSAGVMDYLRENGVAGGLITGLEHSLHGMEVGLSRAFGGEESHSLNYDPTSDEGLRRQNAMYRSSGFTEYLRRRSSRRSQEDLSLGERFHMAVNLSEATGSAGIVTALSAPGVVARVPGNVMLGAERNYRAGARFSETLMYGGAQDERAAALRMRETFGAGAAGANARGAFAENLVDMARQNGAGLGTGSANAAFRIAGSYAAGMLPIEVGNLAGGRAAQGSDFREAFIRSMTREGGMSRAAAERRWDRDPTLAVQQVAPLARLMMTPTERDAFEHTINVGRGMRRPGAAEADYREDQQRAARGLLGGDAGVGTSRTLMSALDKINGVGPEGSTKNIRTRNMIAMMAMAAATTQINPQRSRALLRGLDMEAARSFTPEERDLIQRRAASAQEQFQSGEGQTVARGVMGQLGSRGAGDALSAFGEGTTDFEQAQGAINVGQSMHYLRAAGGPMARLARGMEDGYDQSKFENNLMSMAMDRDQLTALSRQGRAGARMAELIRQYGRGGAAGQQALGDITSILGRQGAQAETTRQEVEGSFGVRAGRIGTALIGALAELHPFRKSDARQRLTRAVDAYRDRRVADELASTSEGEGAAALEGLGASAAESQMAGAGLTTASNSLLDASRQMREAAEIFRDTLGAGNAGRLLPE